MAGIDHVGIGSDFDGGALLPDGLEDVAGFPRLIGELLRRGYSDDDVRAIAGGNVLRVMRATRPPPRDCRQRADHPRRRSRSSTTPRRWRPRAAEPGPVREMRLVVTTDDYEEAVRFYRDVLGLPERASFSSPDGHVVILEAGRARSRSPTPGRPSSSTRSRSAGASRATSGSPSRSTILGDAAILAAGGAKVIAEATRTPWETETPASSAGRAHSPCLGCASSD